MPLSFDQKISMFESESFSTNKSICQSFLQCQPEYINLSANFQKRNKKLKAFNVNLKCPLSTNCGFRAEGILKNIQKIRATVKFHLLASNFEEIYQNET